MNDDLLIYYLNDVPSVLAHSYKWFEKEHSYIQWLFPLPVPSIYNPNAPILDRETIDFFQSNARCQRNMYLASVVMLDFYGLRYQYGVVGCALNWMERYPLWITPKNHNFMRITRMIKSMRILGFRSEARQFFAFLERWYQDKDFNPIIGAETLEYWRKAAHGKDSE